MSIHRHGATDKHGHWLPEIIVVTEDQGDVHNGSNEIDAGIETTGTEKTQRSGTGETAGSGETS